jgi:hypothetical protein
MKLTRAFNFVLSFILILAGLGMTPMENALTQDTPGNQNSTSSPAGLIGPTGTLSLDGRFSGMLDLTEWKVKIDPSRGPVFTPVTASVPGWNVLGSGLNDYVYAIAISGNNVYVGGYFTNAGGIANADGIAKWDGTAWSALGSGISTGAVYTITVNGTDVYAGGYFSDAGGVSDADFIAKWDGAAWSALGSGTFSESVLAIGVDGNTVYAGGNFMDAGGNSDADFIAKWDGSSWSALGSGLNSSVGVIAIEAGEVLVGGSFFDAGGDADADYLAKWDGTSWSAIAGGLNSSVSTIALSGTDLYVGGSFTDAGGVANADYVAKWNGSAWSVLGGGLNWDVYDLALVGTDLYAVGLFTDAGGDPAADRIAKWNGSAWTSLGGAGANNNANAVAVSTSGPSDVDVYVGGCFTGLGGNPDADYIAYYQPLIKQTLKSQAANDGWILESTEFSNSGGTLDTSSPTFNLGDGASDKQYRALISFQLNLPANAVITSAQLKIKQSGTLVGNNNPFTALNGLKFDIRKGIFGATSGLTLSDFQATYAANYLGNAGTFGKIPTSGWYTADLTAAAIQKINLSGLTQFRLRFAKDDNEDKLADYLKFFSGNAGIVASKPQLIIEYYVP